MKLVTEEYLAFLAVSLDTFDLLIFQNTFLSVPHRQEGKLDSHGQEPRFCIVPPGTKKLLGNYKSIVPGAYPG